MNPESSTSLYFILARKAPVGVIFRRGPSKQVQLIKWYRENDTFEEGQWFKGRIYERRCDLSPDGGLLIYFAANYREPLRSWTAISKPPWFTALALWPKGDGWNGGGVFTGPYTIRLNHPPPKIEPHKDFISGCRKFIIGGYAEQAGEDSTVWNETLSRDGWESVQAGEWGPYEEVKGYAWTAKSPVLWRKKHPKHKLILEMAIRAIGKRNDRWYVSTYRVLGPDLNEVVDFGQLDWADWDGANGLVYARQGVLYRQPVASNRLGEPTMLGDFRKNTFQAIKAPEWATKL